MAAAKKTAAKKRTAMIKVPVKRPDPAKVQPKDYKAAEAKQAAVVARTKSISKSASANTSKTSPAALSADPKRLTHGLRALLHTMQTVQRFEESLCSMMHAMERKRPNATMLRELRTTLEGLPANDYRDDVEDLLHALG